MQWTVCLYGIEWDEGYAEDYDDDYGENVEDLPENVEISVEADSKQEAIEQALAETSDEFCFLVQGTKQIVATPVLRRVK